MLGVDAGDEFFFREVGAAVVEVDLFEGLLAARVLVVVYLLNEVVITHQPGHQFDVFGSISLR